ncbi:type II secretion system F family protein [Agromyces sp. H66]|uniref:type II secretion system F family protein n=1 Tax=Agromyces sp. H66 TaxID=2529859 RepID=UPI0020BE2E3B|nr:type II secretion system F family protein [Agromyces sp. H66]
MTGRMSQPLARLMARVGALRDRPDPAGDIDAVAAVTERLAVLLSAGVPAPTAWGHVGDEPETALRGEAARGIGRPEGAGARTRRAVLGAAARAAADGGSVSGAIAGSVADDPASAGAWSVLAAAWAVAAESGAPLATSLRDLAASLRDEAQLRREVRTALAGPVASARLVLALPLIAVAFGALLGFDTVAILFGNPVGLACVVLGGLLLWAGRRWSARLASRASASRADAGLELELLAIAMSGGASIERARGIVGDALSSNGIATHDRGASDAVIALAARAGAPVSDLLRAEAFRLRRVARADGAARAAALGVRLMLPLGACVLPAFVLLGVVPLLVSVVSATLGGGS